MDWALLPDCGAWGHALGALFPSSSLSGRHLIKSPWVCGADYQLVPDLLTGSHCIPPAHHNTWVIRVGSLGFKVDCVITESFLPPWSVYVDTYMCACVWMHVHLAGWGGVVQLPG